MGTTLSALGEDPLEDSFITRIEIDDLFGLYSYRLGEPDLGARDARRLFILYGDNGSGKTTVLQLVFSLLSKAKGQGHRGFLAKTPFRRLLVQLGADTVIEARRLGTDLVGSYSITVTKQNLVVFDANIGVTPENTVLASQPGLEEYVALLEDLDVALFFLTDERRPRSSEETARAADEELLLLRMQQLEFERSKRRVRLDATQLNSEQMLELAIGRFVNWARGQALHGSTAGELNTNTVYTDIIKRIARPRKGRPASHERALDALISDLRALEERTRSYAILGLTSPLAVEALLGAAASAPASTKRIVANVLAPYVNGLKARLNALEPIQKLLTVFVESVNSFLYNKSLSFDLRSGVAIRARNKEQLSPGMLSSGERQLLLLFCNTVLARDSASIFLIDEPEISLNVKWQRKLLDALLSLTSESPVQFVIATHSVELLTRHRRSVRRLGEPVSADLS